MDFWLLCITCSNYPTASQPLWKGLFASRGDSRKHQKLHMVIAANTFVHHLLISRKVCGLAATSCSRCGDRTPEVTRFTQLWLRAGLGLQDILAASVSWGPATVGKKVEFGEERIWVSSVCWQAAWLQGLRVVFWHVLCPSAIMWHFYSSGSPQVKYSELWNLFSSSEKDTS